MLADTIRRAESVDPAVVRARLMVIDAIAPVTTTMRFNAEGEQRYGAISVYQRREGRWDPRCARIAGDRHFAAPCTRSIDAPQVAPASTDAIVENSLAGRPASQVPP